MKKILLFMCSALLIGFSSCSNDDDKDEASNGGWNSKRKISKIETFDDENVLINTEVRTYDKARTCNRCELYDGRYCHYKNKNVASGDDCKEFRPR